MNYKYIIIWKELNFRIWTINKKLLEKILLIIGEHKAKRTKQTKTIILYN